MTEKLGFTKQLLRLWRNFCKVCCHVMLSNWGSWLCLVLGGVSFALVTQPLIRALASWLLAILPIYFIFGKSLMMADQIWRFGKVEKKTLFRCALSKVTRDILLMVLGVSSIFMVILLMLVIMFLIKRPDLGQFLANTEGYITNYIGNSAWLFSVVLFLAVYYLFGLVFWGRGLIWLRDASTFKAFCFTNRVSWSGCGLVASLKVNLLSFIILVPVNAVLFWGFPWLAEQMKWSILRVSLIVLRSVLYLVVPLAITCCMQASFCRQIFGKFLPKEQDGVAS